MCRAFFGQYYNNIILYNNIGVFIHPILGLGVGGGGVSQGIGAKPPYAIFHLGSSKIGVFQTQFFDTVITQSDHRRYVKPVLGSISVLFTLFGYIWWARQGEGRSTNGVVHDVLMQFFALYISKMEVFQT